YLRTTIARWPPCVPVWCWCLPWVGGVSGEWVVGERRKGSGWLAGKIAPRSFGRKITGTDRRRAEAGSRGGDGNRGRESKRFPSPALDPAEHAALWGERARGSKSGSC